MGNRASIVFFDQHQVSPTVYLHWHGDKVPVYLAQLKRLMQGRFNDAFYAAARFVGICHERIPGNLSLGVTCNDLYLRDLHNLEVLLAESPGNAGLIVVDTSDFTWKAYGGYLHELNNQPTEERKIP